MYGLLIYVITEKDLKHSIKFALVDTQDIYHKLVLF